MKRDRYSGGKGGPGSISATLVELNLVMATFDVSTSKKSHTDYLDSDAEEMVQGGDVEATSRGAIKRTELTQVQNSRKSQRNVIFKEWTRRNSKNSQKGFHQRQ